MDAQFTDIISRNRALEQRARSLAGRCGCKVLARRLLNIAGQWRDLRLMTEMATVAGAAPDASAQGASNARH
ncbi:MAG: hypothetical protein AB7I36_07150 [Rhodospirillaceae bacterium]